MNQTPKRRLGRGLAALIGDDVSEGADPGLRQVPLELLFPNPNNPRRQFGEEELAELGQSIREKGLLQPIVVRPRRSGEGFEIVAGERRWRAAQRAQLHEMPALVRELDDNEALEVALIENIQRADLNAVEEGQGYQQLMDRFGYTQQQLADSLGKSRSHVANTLRLLSLPKAVRAHVESGLLSAGHARALVATDAPAELARQVIDGGLSVRETEELARRQPARPRPSPPEKNPDLLALEKEVSEALGLKVQIAHRADHSGSLTIAYGTSEQLDEVCARLRRSRLNSWTV